MVTGYNRRSADQIMRKRQAVSATRREIYEAERRRRSLVVAAASTAVVVLALIVLVPLAPGWEKVQKSLTHFEKVF